MNVSTKKRIGWVITDQLETMPYWPRINTGVSGISLARLHWIMPRVNNDPGSGLYYEVFKPWRQYDGLVFLKAMGDKAHRLSRRYLKSGKPVIFDANVNYYEINGVEHYDGMFPTVDQKKAAVAMTVVASAVIGDSELIAERCRTHNQSVFWLPDNVEMNQVPLATDRCKPRRLRLVWSGDALKLFELLLIEECLRRFSDHIHLVLVTGDLSVLSRWSECYRKRFRRLLDDVSVEILPYRGIEHLFETYSQADVVISPRFLDNSYNLGHTEWKITLGMACGCLAIASPVPSYQTVFDRSSDGEIVICNTSADWVTAFDALLVGGISKETRKLSTQLVDQYYSSEVLAKDHCRVVGQQFADPSH